MAGADLNAVFERLGTLSEGVSGLRRDIEASEKVARTERHQASEAMAKLYGRVDDLSHQVLKVENRVVKLEEDNETTTVVINRIRTTETEFHGARKAGKVALKVAGYLGLASGGGVVATYWDRFVSILTGLPKP